MTEEPDERQDVQSHSGIRSSKERLGRLRIDHYLSDIYTEWFLECRKLQAELSKTGNLGGSVGVQKALEALDLIAVDKVETMLAEIAKAIPTRGRNWDRLHEYALEQIPVQFGDAATKADSFMWRGETASSGVDTTRVPKIISDLRNRVAIHQEGWTAPKPDPFEVRYPVTSKLLLALFAFALGIFAGPVKEYFFPEDHVVEHLPNHSTPEQ